MIGTRATQFQFPVGTIGKVKYETRSEITDLLNGGTFPVRVVVAPIDPITGRATTPATGPTALPITADPNGDPFKPGIWAMVDTGEGASQNSYAFIFDIAPGDPEEPQNIDNPVETPRRAEGSFKYGVTAVDDDDYIHGWISNGKLYIRHRLLPEGLQAMAGLPANYFTFDGAGNINSAELREYALIGDITSAVAVVAEDLADEVTRATDAEGVIAAGLAAEITRATTAENGLVNGLQAAEQDIIDIGNILNTTNTALDLVEAEIAAAKAPYLTLDARLDAIAAQQPTFNGNVLNGATTANITNIEALPPGSSVYYTRADGLGEHNRVDSIDDDEVTFEFPVGGTGIADGALLIIESHDARLSAGTQRELHVRLADRDKRLNSGLLAVASAEDALTIALTTAPANVIPYVTFAVIKQGTIDCNIRLITGVSGTTLTLDRALPKEFAADTPVLFTNTPPFSITNYGARANGSADASPAIAALDADLPPMGGRVDFPIGTFLIERTATITKANRVGGVGVILPRLILVEREFVTNYAYKLRERVRPIDTTFPADDSFEVTAIDEPGGTSGNDEPDWTDAVNIGDTIQSDQITFTRVEPLTVAYSRVLDIQNVSDCEVDGLRFDGTGLYNERETARYMIFAKGGETTMGHSLRIRNVSFINMGFGPYRDPPDGTHCIYALNYEDVRIDDIYANYVNGSAVFLISNRNVRVRGATVWNARWYPIHLDSEIEDFEVSGCTVINNTEAAYYGGMIDLMSQQDHDVAPVRRGRVFGCTLQGMSDYGMGVRVDSTSEVDIYSNIFYEIRAQNCVRVESRTSNAFGDEPRHGGPNKNVKLHHNICVPYGTNKQAFYIDNDNQYSDPDYMGPLEFVSVEDNLIVCPNYPEWRKETHYKVGDIVQAPSIGGADRRDGRGFECIKAGKSGLDIPNLHLLPNGGTLDEGVINIDLDWFGPEWQEMGDNPVWQAGHNYELHDRMTLDPHLGRCFVCVEAGLSHLTNPPTAAATAAVNEGDMFFDASVRWAATYTSNRWFRQAVGMHSNTSKAAGLAVRRNVCVGRPNITNVIDGLISVTSSSNGRQRGVNIEDNLVQYYGPPSLPSLPDDPPIVIEAESVGINIGQYVDDAVVERNTFGNSVPGLLKGFNYGITAALANDDPLPSTYNYRGFDNNYFRDSINVSPVRLVNSAPHPRRGPMAIGQYATEQYYPNAVSYNSGGPSINSTSTGAGIVTIPLGRTSGARFAAEIIGYVFKDENGSRPQLIHCIIEGYIGTGLGIVGSVDGLAGSVGQRVLKDYGNDRLPKYVGIGPGSTLAIAIGDLGLVRTQMHYRVNLTIAHNVALPMLLGTYSSYTYGNDVGETDADFAWLDKYRLVDVGRVRKSLVAETAYTVEPWDRLIAINGVDRGVITLTLRAANLYPIGEPLFLRDEADIVDLVNKVTLVPDGAAQIEGVNAPFDILIEPGQSTALYTNGTNWFLLDRITQSRLELISTLFVNKQAETAVAEILAQYMVSDDPLNMMRLVNAVTTAGRYDPRTLAKLRTGSNPSIGWRAELAPGADTGTTPIFIFQALIDALGDGTSLSAIALRNLFAVRDQAGVDMLRLGPTGNTLIAGKLTVGASNGNVGTFTMPAAASFQVPNTGVTANSRIAIESTNAAASLLKSGVGIYYTKQAGVGFTVFTRDGSLAAGTETFDYILLN